MAQSPHSEAVTELIGQTEQRAADLAKRLAEAELKNQLDEIRFEAKINKIRVEAETRYQAKIDKIRGEAKTAERQVEELDKMRIVAKLADQSDAKNSQQHAGILADDRSAVELTEIRAAVQLNETRTAAEQAKIKAIELIKMSVKTEPEELSVAEQPASAQQVAELAKIREAAKQAEQHALKLAKQLAANQLTERLAHHRKEVELDEIRAAAEQANKQVAELNKMRVRAERPKRPVAELDELDELAELDENNLEQANLRAYHLAKRQVSIARVTDKQEPGARSSMDEQSSDDRLRKAYASTKPKSTEPYLPQVYEPKEPEMKLAVYMEKEIDVKNPEQVEKTGLFPTMKEKFSNGYKKWKHRSNKFKIANLVVTILVVLIQVVQVIIFQIPIVKDSPGTQALATILPAITGAVLAIHNRLKWSEKAYKAKQTADLYNHLCRHMDYRSDMLDAGGELTGMDAVKIWNTALQLEQKEAPAFLPYF